MMPAGTYDVDIQITKKTANGILTYEEKARTPEPLERIDSRGMRETEGTMKAKDLAARLMRTPEAEVVVPSTFMDERPVFGAVVDDVTTTDREADPDGLTKMEYDAAEDGRTKTVMLWPKQIG
jgi:hypothetical protein